MTAPARFTKADIKRAVSGALEGGAEDVLVRVTLDGTLEIRAGSHLPAATGGNPLDRLLKDAP